VNRNNNFDFLRFVSASLVLFSHSYPLTGCAACEPITRITGLDTGGGFAVATFFVLSGYLVTGSYLGSATALEYFGKRFLRLFPALLASVLLTAFVIGPVATSLSLSGYFFDPQFRWFFGNLYLQPNYGLPGVFLANPFPGVVNGSLWTLPIEFLMYLIVLVLGMLRCLTPRIVAVLIGLLWLGFFRLLSELGLGDAVLFSAVPLREAAKLGAIFFSGAFLYLVRERFKASSDLALLAVLILAATGFTGAGPAALMAALPILVLWLAFLPLEGLSRFGKYGDFSYGIYIYAFPVQQCVIQALGSAASPLIVFVCSFVPALILAVLSWHLIEKPALELKRLFWTTSARRVLTDATR